MTSEEIEKIRAERTERAQRRAERRLRWAESAEKKSAKAYEAANSVASMIPFGQPILVGHHSERGDRATRSRITSNFRKSFEESKKADYHRQKAENILAFGTRVKGDAERARQAKREEADKQITINSRVSDVVFGMGTVVQVNKKTYSIRFESGSVYARDKSWVKVI